MKFLRLIDLIAVLAPVMLPAVLTSAQSDLGARANQPTVSLPTQGSSAGSTVRLDPPEQKAQLHFAPAVAYDSGASEADSVALADLNGDGNVDLAFTSSNAGTVTVLLGTGTGTFSALGSYATGNGAESVAASDFNGDGIADLVVANSTDSTVSILLGNGDGTLQAATTFTVGTTPASVAVADFNGDGNADIVTAAESAARPARLAWLRGGVEVCGWSDHPRLLRHHHPKQNIGHLANGENQDRQEHGDDSNQGDVPTVLVGKPAADAGQLSASQGPGQRSPRWRRRAGCKSTRFEDRLAAGGAKARVAGQRCTTSGTI